MEKIKKYVIGFFKKVSIRRGYDISQEEWKTLAIEAKESPTDTVIMSFLYGYAKGYRAAMAEMKKGGAA